MILLENIFMYPIITINDAMELLIVSYPTAVKIIENFCRMDILLDITQNQKRNKRYAFSTYGDYE